MERINLEAKRVGRILTVGGIFLTTACNPPEGIIRPSFVSTPTTEPKATVPSNQGVFITGLGEVRWFNNSYAVFHPNRARTLYLAFETFGRERRRFETEIFTRTITDNEVIFITLTVKDFLPRTLTLRPISAPPPPWARRAADYGDIEQSGKSDSFLTIYTNKRELPGRLGHLEPEDLINNSLHQVACRTTLEMIASPAISLKIEPARLQEVAKLFVCNTLALAFDSKIYGLSYQQYLNKVQEVDSFFVIPLGVGYRFSTFLTQQEYDRLPEQKVIRIRTIPPPRRL